MKNLINYLIVFSMSLTSCHPWVSANGKRHCEVFPVFEKHSDEDLDTSNFYKEKFNIENFSNKIPCKNEKRIIDLISGADLKTIAEKNKHYYVYLWNSACPGTPHQIYKLDSLAKKGEKIMVVSVRKNYADMMHIISKTSFNQLPLYSISSKEYPKILNRRIIEFITDACPSCYKDYRDELMGIDLLLIENGNITPILFSEKSERNLFAK